jgi:hypothetical protein
MRWSIIGVVTLACVAAACHAGHSIYMDPGNRAQSEKAARDSQAAEVHKPTTSTGATEPRVQAGS